MGQVVLLPTQYRPPEARERPVPRARIAEAFGVCGKTVDRWVARDGMPEGECWIVVGVQRRYYPTRVKEWLATQEPRFGRG